MTCFSKREAHIPHNLNTHLSFSKWIYDKISTKLFMRSKNLKLVSRYDTTQSWASFKFMGSFTWVAGCLITGHIVHPFVSLQYCDGWGKKFLKIRPSKEFQMVSWFWSGQKQHKLTLIFLIRNWFIRNWGYRGQNFMKLECHIIPTLKNRSAANSRNSIFGVHEIHNFSINSSS